MSGQGAPAITVEGAEQLKVVVIASEWHTTVMDGLLDGARRALSAAGVTDVTELRVPGAFELPVAAARVAAHGVDAIVALGVVLRGGTPHFDFVCQAAATGLPIVASRLGGMPESMREGETGFLVPERDEQALSDRMAELLEDPAKARRMGAAGRALVEDRFDIDRQTATLEAHYDSLVGQA